MAEAAFQAIVGVLQMVVPGSAVAGIVMQLSCLAAAALAVRVLRKVIGK